MCEYSALFLILAHGGRIIVLKVRMGEFCLKNLQFERGMRMKKSSIALFVAAALFLLCSFTFLPDRIGEFASGVAVAVFPEAVSCLTETRFLLLGTLASSDGHGLLPRKRNAPAVIQFCGRSFASNFNFHKNDSKR